MKKTLIACLVLTLALPGLVGAQSEESADEAEEKAAREALRQELQQARREVAEAARELARIQRQLADTEIEGLRIERLRSLEGMDEEFAGMEERIHREVIRGLRMTRPRLGVLLGNDDGDANAIIGVTPGSGAEKAGIEAGDRLVSINGRAVDASDSESLSAAMDGVAPGDSVPVEVERDGETRQFDVTVSSPARDFRVITHDIRGPHHVPGAPDAPESPDAPRIDREVIVLRGDEPMPPMPPMPPRLTGLGRHTDMVSNHDGLAPYFGTAEGVVVLRIDADNPLKLQDGDVVLSIDGEAVSRPIDIGRALLGRGGRSVSLEVMRDGERLTLDAELPESEAVSLFAPHAPGVH